MTARVLDSLEQGTDAWREIRAGVPTASRFAAIMAQGKGAATYLHRLAAEIITGGPIDDVPQTAAMARGLELEPSIRAMYELETDNTVRQVGFVLNDIAGCSPDGMIGEAGLIEIKTRRPDLMIPALLDGTTRNDYRPQVQGQLWVTEREWCDLVTHAPGMGTLIERCYRDESYIADLERTVTEFVSARDRVVEKLRSALGDSGTVKAVLEPDPPLDLAAEKPVF